MSNKEIMLKKIYKAAPGDYPAYAEMQDNFAQWPVVHKVEAKFKCFTFLYLIALSSVSRSSHIFFNSLRYRP